MNEINCTEYAGWLHAYLDNELDTQSSLRVRAHLDRCTECKKGFEEMTVLRQGLREGLAYHPAPERLRQNFLSQLPRRSSSVSASSILGTWRRLWMPAFSTAALAAAVLLYVVAPTQEDRLVDEVVTTHVRSLMADHLMDVASTDQHTVKPWFEGKLDFSPPVEDFASSGFPLVGGRLDYLDKRQVAAMVYRRHLHVINLVCWPVENGKPLDFQKNLRGFHIIFWNQNGFQFGAISDLNETELRQFVQLSRLSSK